MITVNGKQIQLTSEMSVADYLEQNNYQINRIAVEMNEEILPKYSYMKHNYYVLVFPCFSTAGLRLLISALHTRVDHRKNSPQQLLFFFLLHIHNLDR